MNKKRIKSTHPTGFQARRDHKDTMFRNLFYVSKTYQNLIRNETLYSSRILRLPTPCFFVFYNGTVFQDERCILKLSDCFAQSERQAKEINLELPVLVLNITQGKNRELLEMCQTLKEYMIFVERVRNYANMTELNEAVEKAVDECIQEGVLADFLLKNRTEAIEMCILEYDEEREIKLIRKAEYEDGREAGLLEGTKKLLNSQIRKKIAKGKTAVQIAQELEMDLSVIEDAIRDLTADPDGPTSGSLPR